MSRRYQTISSDGHLEIPVDGWIGRVPEEHRERAPRLIKLADGGEGWLVEGMPLIHNGTNIAGGRMMKIIGASYWEEDGTPAPGTGSPAQRLREQDRDGIDAEVLFPPVFIGRYIENISDRDAYLAMVRAYNDFLAEDYCAVAPDRLLATALIPVTGIEDALAELDRVRGLGLTSVCLSHFPNGTTEPTNEDDRFWERALELDMPVTSHVTIGSRSHPMLVSAAAGRYELPSTLMRGTVPPPLGMITGMIANGVFDRIPDLRLYIAETNAGWLPEVLYMMDDSYDTFREALGYRLKLTPSEYVSRHLLFGIVRDRVAIQCRDLLPVENLMWGSDFPHSVTTYPRSRDWLDHVFADAPAGLREQVLLHTPCRYFRLDPQAELTPTSE
ncbi:amidohydrolase family protein [Micromonospora sp. NBRC 101691]|uniref:amidohydrolase family protein n=1 Tax=Micromonospora TaxID=1873 RepID=UPI0024A1BD71|nr:amidohydrolase family protein [Micromonospora sp. NBRC 101691]GLY26213.1 amidohydrolase [Micromonospora sp. NBRC 101691]